MSRFSPTIQPTSGRALAQALGQSVNAYLGAKRLRREDDIADEMRQRSEGVQNAQLGEQGIHLLAPGQSAPVAPASEVNAGIAHALNPSAGLPEVAAPDPRFQSGQGYYIDRQEQQQGLQRTANAQLSAALAKALGTAQAQSIVDPYAVSDRHAVAQSTVERNHATATQPRAPLPGTPEWERTIRKKAEIEAEYRPAPQPQIVSAVDPTDGTPHFYRVPKAGGSAQEVSGVAPKPGSSDSGSGGGMGQAVQARLLGAIAEARAASQRMDAYEDKILADPSKLPNKMTQIGGKLATRLSGSHSLAGVVGETAGEAVTDPEFLQYMRDAGLMARATQLMSSRGGSEAMVSSEQLLNRAVPNAAGLAASIAAARKSRNAIFGQAGGLMQALTPQQITKVEAGLAALERGESGSPALLEAARVIEQARSHPAAHAPTAGHASHAQSLWDAAVAKYGKDRVLKEYGPRPNE